MLPIKNEVVEVVYAGQTIRGVAVEVSFDSILVRTSFGERSFHPKQVTGLRFFA